MSQTSPLIYPTVDLFLYDLQTGLGQSSDQINLNRRRFWQRIYDNSLDEKRLVELQSAEETFSNYIELLGTQRVERFKHPLDGYYYPVKLGDTYALQIDCSGKEHDPDWQQLSFAEQLVQIKDIILQHTREIPGEMGHSWLVWGKLASPNQDPVTTAQDCYDALKIVPKPDWKHQYKGNGTFQGTTLFELEQPERTPDGLNRNYHILICLFPHDQTDEEIDKTIGQLYRNLISLFHYRNKILWVYEQSRQLKNELKNASGRIQKIVDSLSGRITDSRLNLNQLQQDLVTALSLSYAYETSLGYLQDHASTIKINVQNYKERVQALEKLDSQSDLKFLNRFSEYAQNKYLSQVDTDHQSLEAGLKPLETFIRTIEGITEIEKTKNERTLNQTIALASVGISTASLAASTFTEQAEGIVKTLPSIPSGQVNFWAFGLSFSISLLIGILSVLITWAILGSRPRK